MRRRGFILVYVLLILLVALAGLMWLEQATDILVCESNRLYAEACAENLAASGQAWARRHPEAASKPAAGDNATGPARANAVGSARDLDVQGLGTPRGRLSIGGPRPATPTAPATTTAPAAATAPAARVVRAECTQGRYRARREAVVSSR